MLILRKYFEEKNFDNFLKRLKIYVLLWEKSQRGSMCHSTKGNNSCNFRDVFGEEYRVTNDENR